MRSSVCLRERKKNLNFNSVCCCPTPNAYWIFRRTTTERGRAGAGGRKPHADNHLYARTHPHSCTQLDKEWEREREENQGRSRASSIPVCVLTVRRQTTLLAVLPLLLLRLFSPLLLLFLVVFFAQPSQRFSTLVALDWVNALCGSVSISNSNSIAVFRPLCLATPAWLRLSFN